MIGTNKRVAEVSPRIADAAVRAVQAQARPMPPTFRRLLALAAAFAALTLGEAATAQGVYVPMPGSAPAATGPNSVNPSAAASAVDPDAHNPSAAPSAVTTLNALNPSATPSTFAPQLSAPDRSRVLIGPVDPLYGIVPGSGRRRMARMPRRSRGVIQSPQGRSPVVRAPAQAFRAPSQPGGTMRGIEESICRGC